MYRVMMEFVHVVLAVLSLLSVGHSAPATNCESLTQPLEIQGRDQVKHSLIQFLTFLSISYLLFYATERNVVGFSCWADGLT